MADVKTDLGEKVAGPEPAIETGGQSPGEADAQSKPEPDAQAEADAQPEAETRAATRRPRLPRISDPFRLLAVGAVVLAACCTGWFGWSWYGAAHDNSLSFSRARDSALQAGEQGVLNMNTLDYRSVDQGLDRWLSSTTGDLQQQISQGRSQFQAQVQQAKTITTAKLLDGGVLELDDRAGKATVNVAVQITVTPQSGAPATKQSRMQAQLTRTPAGWKLSALAQVPMGNSGASGTSTSGANGTNGG